MLGKKIRLERIIDRNTGKTIIVPMDHGVTVGPIDGLLSFEKTIDAVANGGANAVVGHVGLPIWGHRSHGKDVGLILHLSASTMLNPTDPNDKVLINSVPRALKMGADGVSVHVNVGSKNESAQLEILGKIAGDCLEWGIPLLAMMYPRGEGLTDPEKSSKMVKIAARVGAELGADIIKTYYTGNTNSMREVVEGCPAPIVIAGGSKLSDEETLTMIRGAMDAGCIGLSMGRNAFQHKNPEKFISAAAKIVNKNFSIEEALGFLKN